MCEYFNIFMKIKINKTNLMSALSWDDKTLIKWEKSNNNIIN